MYAMPYKCATRRYDLCLAEKDVIARADQTHLLNKISSLNIAIERPVTCNPWL